MEERKAMLTEPDYIEQGGSVCPYCLGDDVRGGELHFVDGDVWMDISCGSCGRRWEDDYRLSGYSESHVCKVQSDATT